MKLLCLALLELLFLCSGSCHVQMDEPMAFRNPNDYNLRWDEKDYNIQDPLFLNGTNFPCKGYHHQAPSSAFVRKYNAGSVYDLRLIVGAQNGGGTCELSLSYDSGNTFRVFKRFIGGCPSSSHEFKSTFTIPDYAPSGERVIFSWSYHPKQGASQMWQNCAFVDIEGIKNKEDQARFRMLPSIFRAGLYEFDADCWSENGWHLLPPNTNDVEIEFSPDAEGNIPSPKMYPSRFPVGKCDNDELIKSSWAYIEYNGMNQADCNVAPIVPCNKTAGWPFRESYIKSCRTGLPVKCRGHDTMLKESLERQQYVIHGDM